MARRVSGPERLADLGLSMPLIHTVLARADVGCAGSWLDPPILEGLLRWGRTTRFLREALIPAGWSFDNHRNFARTIHPSGEFAVVVSTGDELTGSTAGDPGTRHSKGLATALAVHANGQLGFDLDLGVLAALVPSDPPTSWGRMTTWFLLYCVDEQGFRAEVSLPDRFADGRITGWDERVLVPALARRPLSRTLLARSTGSPRSDSRGSDSRGSASFEPARGSDALVPSCIGGDVPAATALGRTRVPVTPRR